MDPSAAGFGKGRGVLLTNYSPNTGPPDSAPSEATPIRLRSHIEVTLRRRVKMIIHI